MNKEKDTSKYPNTDIQSNTDKHTDISSNTTTVKKSTKKSNSTTKKSSKYQSSLDNQAVSNIVDSTPDISHTLNVPVLPDNTEDPRKTSRVAFVTHEGHALTPNEAKFIDCYIETGNGSKSVVDAGYKCKAPRQYASDLLSKPYIASEIRYRLQQAKTDSIATAEEIMQYFTDVMRGKITDQFGLDASLSERTKAAQELAKRQIDIPNRLAGNEEPTLTIKLDFGQGGEEKTDAVKPNIEIEGLSD